MERRRGRIEIIHDMLITIRRKRISKPTYVMYKANLSHSQMKGYVAELLELGLINTQRHGQSEQYLLTEKGEAFLEKIREMKRYEQAFGI